MEGFVRDQLRRYFTSIIIIGKSPDTTLDLLQFINFS